MEERKSFRENIFKVVNECIHSVYAEKLVTVLISFFAGLLSSRGLFFGRYSPIGVAMVASVPRRGMGAAALGAFLGYIIPSPVYVPARYCAAIVAVVAIRWSLSEMKPVNTHPLFAPIITLLPLLLTGLTMVFLSGALTYSTALYIAESLLGAGCAFFLRRTSDLITSYKPNMVFDTPDLASVMMTACVLLLSLSGVTIANVSVARVLTVIMVLYCARVGGVSGGAIAGVISGAVQGLSTAGLTYLSGAYGLGGLVAGIFAPMGKFAVAVAFVLTNGIASLQAGETGEVFYAVVEVAVATVVYMLLPKSRRIAELFSARKETISGDALRNNIVLRLKFASDAVSNIYTSVEEVSQKLSAVSATEMRGVYNKSIENVCAGCAKSLLCWKKYKEETLENFNGVSAVIKDKTKIDSSDFSKEFLDRCTRKGEMKDEINKNYSRYLAKQAAEINALQIKEIAQENFKTTSDMLGEMAEEFARYELFDTEAAERVSEIMLDNGIKPIEVCCRVDKYDRMTIEAEIEKEREKRINRAAFAKEISSACARVFSPPCVTRIDDKCRLQMCQRPFFDCKRGFSQYNANNGTFCGDSAAVFYDGNGRLIALISDGMGTGGRAAVDGAMTAAMAESLLKAGIGLESTLQTVNSALMAKSGDESLATLDIAVIDLFTGVAEFKKAGAAGTVIRRSRRTEYVELSSMPAGIMPSISFASTERELHAGDTIVMVSDGVVATGGEWLVDFVENSDRELEPNALAEQIIQYAAKNRSDGHEDDMSVLVLELEE